jgi:hypothetical protein
MIGNFNLPLDKASAKTFVFTPSTNTSYASSFIGLQRWEKPKGINFVYGIIIGPGSGGGGGGTLGGGGGGTPGTYYTFLQPAFLVPDYLYIAVGEGGAGGAAGANGSFATNGSGLFFDSVSVTNSTNLSRLYYVSLGIQSGNASGRAGTGAAAGAGGTVVNYSSNQVGTYGFSSNNTVLTTSTGFNGGLTTAGVDAPFLGRPQGGAGGGGRSGGAKVGGNVICPSTSANSIWNRNLSGGAATGAAGENGVTLFNPTLFFLPGAGGGANDAGVGGQGGDAGTGCGGGGGGAGSVTGGAGGKGGDGLIILTCW